MKKNNITLLALLLAYTHTARAETIQLKDGSVIKGSIATMDEQNVTVDTADLGRVTIKRRNIQAIRDGAENSASGKSEAPANININVNNQQSNAQKNDQSNEQKSEQQSEQKVNLEEPETKESKNKPLVWQSGIFGRLGAGPRRIEISGLPQSKAPLNTTLTKSIFAIDIIGYRFDNLISAALTAHGGTIGKAQPVSVPAKGGVETADVDVISGGIRFDFNFFRSAYGNKSLSQWYLGPSFATESFEVKNSEDKKLSETSFRADGRRLGLDLGYEYFFGPNLGVALTAMYGQSELKKFTFGHDASVYDYTPQEFTDKKIKIISRAVILSLAWNINI